MLSDPMVGPILWQQLLEKLREQISPQNFKIWFEPVRATVEQNQLTLFVPNQFFHDWISDNYLSNIKESLTQLGYSAMDLSILCEQETAPEVEVSTTPAPPMNVERARTNTPAPSGILTKPQLIERYTFDSFVVGPSNEFAHAACRAVATDPANSYNPLFIYGGVGLGKTHLIHAIGREILTQHKQMRVIYLSAEQFMNDMITAIRMDKMVETRKRYRDNCDVLLIDDIQFIAGKKMTQEEFFHMFNYLHSANRQIIITSDKYPQDIPELEERLRSRFQWGLIADIQAPELETRMAIITKKAERDGIKLANEVVLFLASSMKSNIRELEGCLSRLEAYASLTGKQISLEMAREVLRNLLPDRAPTLSINVIQKCVAEHYGVSIAEMKGEKRHKRVLIPRQVAMYLCRKRAQSSYPEIGENFGGKDHSTAINAFQKIERLMKKDQQFRAEVMMIEARLQG